MFKTIFTDSFFSQFKEPALKTIKSAPNVFHLMFAVDCVVSRIVGCLKDYFF